MRLTFKLTLGTLIGVALLLAINVTLRVQREVETFSSEMMRDHLMLSRALRVDIIDEWHDGGEPAAFQLIQRINAERQGIDITAWRLGQVPDDIAFTLNEGREVQRVEPRGGARDGDDDDAGDVLVTWSPIAPRGLLLASLRIEESLASVDAYVFTTLERTATSAVIGLLVIAVISWVFGFFAVGRPVQALIDKARRVGRGDLEGDVRLRRSDELSVLADELNVMSQRLKEARLAVQTEAEARVRAVEQLRHADRLSTVGTLAAGIAHELGTPLNVVLGRAQMIAAAHDRPRDGTNGSANGGPDVAGVVDDTRRQALIINEQTQKVIRIVRQLLDFARAEQPDVDDVELGALCRATRELLAPIADEKGVVLRLEGIGVDGGDDKGADEGRGDDDDRDDDDRDDDDDDRDDDDRDDHGGDRRAGGVWAHVDRGQLQQAVTNLLVNAIQATPAGGSVTLRALPHARPSSLSSLPAGRYVALDVEDEGSGLSDVVRQQLFSPFFTTKPPGQGTGLGLAVAWGIVRDNGGAIEVDVDDDDDDDHAVASPPSPRRGALFRILLPEVP